MLEKMKMISRKAVFVLLAFLILAAVPAKSAEAKVNPDVSNVVNKNISQVAKYLKIEKFKEKDDFFNMITYNKPKKGSKDEYAIALSSSKPKQKGNWSINIRTNKVSLYGINISMTYSQINSILTKRGFTGGMTDYMYAMYEDKQGRVISIYPKNQSANSKMLNIVFKPKPSAY